MFENQRIPYLAFVAIAVGVLLLICNTFFLGNLLNAILIVMIGPNRTR